MLGWTQEGASVKVTVYEVGPRDGLQFLQHTVETQDKRNLIDSLYKAGIENIEEVSFAHPKVIPQMADAEKVFTGRGAGLVMNKRGFDRAMISGVKKINIVLSPCENFNIKSFRMTRSELMFNYFSFMNKIPKENVKDAKVFGNTVVFSDTIGIGNESQVRKMAKIAFEEGMIPALHLHHDGDENKPISLVRTGLLAGIKQFDSSIGGLGGCPMVKNSGANLSTETLVKHLDAWGLETGIKNLTASLKIVKRIKQEPLLLV